MAEANTSNLPFGKKLALSSISGPTYVTAQSLIQQTAYVLSDKLFTYSPDTFDLDTLVKDWAETKEQNGNGYATGVHPMQIRAGAGSVALGYIFSSNFDAKKRHIPQGLIASSSALQFLKPALDQLSLLYKVSNPFVAHVSAVDYSGSRDGSLVADYISALSIADELGFSLISSNSPHEAQHMALLSTVLAQDLPTIHISDGVKVGHETTRVVDVLDSAGLTNAYSSIISAISGNERNHLTLEGKAIRALKGVNEELGTDYKAFEYHGHEDAEVVLVTFGSVESSLAAQTATTLARSGSKVGVVNVRVYRPFIEEQFLSVLPSSARTIGVLGQVYDTTAIQDSSIHSQLYEDVLATLSYGPTRLNKPEIHELKYARTEKWSPSNFAGVFSMLFGKSGFEDVSFLDDSVQQYSFWNVDDSSSACAAQVIAQALAKDSSQNVTVSTTHDNMVQGGTHRVDIRKSPKTLNAAYSIDSADIAVVAEAKLLEKVDIIKSIKAGGKIILLLPGVKDTDVEKKIPAATRKAIAEKGIALFLIDANNSSVEGDHADLEALILQTAFLRIALGDAEEFGRQKLAAITSDIHTLDKVAADLEKTLRSVEVPNEWVETEVEKQALPTDISSNSFVSFDKSKEEAASLLRNWHKAAKGLLFKEAYNTHNELRPDLPTKTFTVHVKENRRLTPITYNRNIFHIEFDLGTSGLKYNIGEALGIHAENNHEQVMDFIRSYGLNADDIVEVAARDSTVALENRTVYQALMQNIDIFGRPPKKFYESLAEFTTDENDKKNLLTLAGPEGFKEFQRRAEVDTVTYADVLEEFPSARPSFHDLVRIVAPMKRREYSIASCQAVTPTSVALMIVVVNWVDPKGRDRFGQATRYLSGLKPGVAVTVSVKPSVMKLPTKSTAPLIMAGLGTGLAPFRAFVQHRAMEKAQGKEIGSVLLYMGSRHQREEYCYGEEWEAYQAAGVITLLGRAFSRDQPQKIYIQDRMRQTMDEIIKAYVKDEGSFYLCGPTWPVPDVTNVLEEAIARDAKANGVKKIDPSREIMRLKDEGRYVLEVY